MIIRNPPHSQSLDKANTTRLPRLKREFKVEHSDALAHVERRRHTSICRPPKHCQQSARPKPSQTRTLGWVFGPAAAGLCLTVWGRNTLHLNPPILCHSMANPGLSGPSGPNMDRAGPKLLLGVLGKGGSSQNLISTGHFNTLCIVAGLSVDT